MIEKKRSAESEAIRREFHGVLEGKALAAAIPSLRKPPLRIRMSASFMREQE